MQGFPQTPCEPQPHTSNLQTIQTQDTEMKKELQTPTADMAEDLEPRPYWLKSKYGVKKLSNRERRRRQNENLRRLLTPKNALMALNEMKPNEQNFKVEVATNVQYYKTPNQPNFCADLTLDGNNYKGYGENKLMARNAAAEQAIRDLVIKKMNKALEGDEGSTMDDGDGEPLPMIQLASFALHKLFSEWEYEGHKVPQLKPSPPEPEAPPTRELPADAANMHPCMLLTYMRPHLEYREIAVEGDRPQNTLFTLGVDIDGIMYVGKASNKKEARKQAAKAACKALYGVQFADQPAPVKRSASHLSHA